MEKYPLLLKPVIKDYLWGGTRLKDEYGFETDKEIAAEGWMLASHKDGTNVVANGELVGKTFDEALRSWGEKEVAFPLLIKLIDAKDKLSVQVHPEDEYAYRVEHEPGKTEMWYIVDCEEGAQLIYGFKRRLDKEEFATRIKNNTLDEVMNYVPVKKGDVFFIAAGTLHAIGSGMLIAEIQQNSNTTYRVSDYGRLGTDGKPRELHIEKALAGTKTEPPFRSYGDIAGVKEYTYGSTRELARCKYFKVKSIRLNGRFRVNNKKFTSLLILEGHMRIKYQGGEIRAKKGDSIYIPGGCSASVSGNGEVICSREG